MSPSFGIEAIAGLIPIYLHLQKLRGRSQLRAHTLSPNHILWLLLESRLNIHKNYHCLLLDSLTKCQCEMIKDLIVDINNRFNEVSPFLILIILSFLLVLELLTLSLVVSLFILSTSEQWQSPILLMSIG